MPCHDYDDRVRPPTTAGILPQRFATQILGRNPISNRYTQTIRNRRNSLKTNESLSF